MADAISQFDWSSTPLGSVDGWVSSLRCAVDLMLSCAFPTTLQWGPQLLLFYNDAYIPLIGDRHPAALGKPILETFPEIVPIYGPLAKRVLEGERIVLEDQLYRYTRSNVPENFWFDLSYTPIHDEDGAIVGILAIGFETSARILAEKARSEAETRLRLVLETDAVGVIFFDHTGTVVDANDVFLGIVGYSKQEVAERRVTWRTLTPPEWVAASEEQMERLATTGRIGPYEKQYILRDGTRRWMLFAGRDLGDGTIAEFCIDVTGRRSAEEATHAIEQRFRALVQATSEVVYQMSPDWTEMRQLQGRDFLTNTSEADRDWLKKYIHPDDQQQVRDAIEEAIRTQSTFELEHRVLRADGQLGWTLSRAIPLIDEQGVTTEWFGTATDITSRKHAEEALLRSEKLATLGRLAATIAHEINNPLEATTNMLYLIQTSDGLPEATRQLAISANAELNRVAHITRQSLGLYREGCGPTPTSVAELLESSIDLLRAKIMGKNASIHRVWNGSHIIRAVSGELRQVFSNLLANSLDALQPDGHIWIRVKKRKSSNSVSGCSVQITFADNGSGIAPEARPLIFDPLFSTKGDRGTGLGLWVTKQIVTKHGGSIRMRSRTEGGETGTVFALSFPEAS